MRIEFSEELFQKLSYAAVVTVLTGAGVSAESGISTFRGEKGLWKKFKPEELADFNAFLKNPELVWEWYSYRQKVVCNAEPNPGHYALVEMEDYFKCFHIITQNIDGLHKKAGNIDPIELHGNIMRNRCIGCDNIFYEIKIDSERNIPECDNCGDLIRPDVVWFGEQLPADEVHRANLALAETDVFFSIGTSAIVQPAASMPFLARNNNAYIVEINIEETQLTPFVDEYIRGKSGEILPVIMKELKKRET
ncbi:NAD-dependent deacylase [candidate division KSB1 bacterium]